MKKKFEEDADASPLQPSKEQRILQIDNFVVLNDVVLSKKYGIWDKSEVKMMKQKHQNVFKWYLD